MKRILVGCSVSAIALFAMPAAAQTADPQSTAPAAKPSNSGDQVEDIIVTATRRNERQQDVPIAITTVTAAAAERQGVTGTESLGLAVASLQFGRQTGNGATPTIRGVGFTQASLGTEGPNAVLVDDVYLGTPSGSIFEFNNIESIEVLKGPQGTLFGRNATGGVIHIQTKKPNQNAEFDANLGYGSYDTIFGSAYANVPLTSTLAMNVAFAGKDQRKGYGYSLITGEDTLKAWSYGVRGELLWKPGPHTSLLLIGDYSRGNGDIGMSVVIQPGTLTSVGARNQGRFATYDYPRDSDPTKDYGVSAKITQDVGSLKFVSISAYRFSSYCLNLNTNATTTGAYFLVLGCKAPPGFESQQSRLRPPFAKTYSQEFHLLSSETGPFTWLLGAYYYQRDTDAGAGGSWGSTQPGGFTLNSTLRTTRLRSYSGFADATWEFLPRARVTGGIRYTEDDLSRNTPVASAKFPKWTYRAVLDYRFTPDIMVYASRSRGFHTGALPAGGSITLPGGQTLTPPDVLPETLDATEVGLKSEFLNRRARLNISGYHYDYANLQVAQVISGGAIVLNAGGARMNGVDVDWSYVPVRNFTLNGGFAYLDAKFTNFPGGPINVPKPGVCTPVPMNTGPLTGGNLNCTTDLRGFRPPRAPQFTMNISATYTIPSSVGEFTLNGSLAHTSSYFWEPDNQWRQPEVDLVTANIGWKSPDGKYEIKVYGRNLLNKYYFSYFSTSATRDAGSPAMPRNFGVVAGVHF